MKTNLTKFCAVVLLAAQTFVLAQKTEVSVQKGKVIAETATQSVTIGAGRKAVLTANEKPKVAVDNPLVSDALLLYKLIEAEKEHGDLKIDSTFILVGKADEEKILGALLFEFPNHESEATNVLTLGPASIMEGLQVYDLNGNLCQLDVKLVNETTAFYSIHVSEQVQPGEHFKLIGVVDLENMPTFPGGAPAYGKEGSLWYFRTINGTPNCLNYFRFILPKSAILVDSNHQVIATDTVDSRLAVTMRNYTGPYSDGLCMISFLWPDEDGTTLADIPGKYRGLRSKEDEQNIEIFRQEMDKIRTGIKFEDQSTPLGALLTCLSSIIRKDLDLYVTVKYTEQPPEKIQRHVEQAGYWANILDVLSTPEWPDNPGNGYVHPIYLCRKGTMICEFIQPFVYEDGKWYDNNTKSKQLAEIENITAQDIAAVKAKGYLCDWEVAGPYIQKGKKCSELFDIPFGPELANVDVPWQSATVEPYEQHPASVDISSALLPMDQSVAYLRTEIISDTQKPARLEIYTDDGVKAWLNGKLIHEDNNSRGIPEQPDAVNVTLKQGVNHLMLKVTEDIWGSRAIVRIGVDRAAGPRPADKAIHPKTKVRLDWTPAVAARSHRVYFGTDENDLSLLAEVSEVKELQPLSLEEGHRYYWRVDEVLADGSNFPGDVWTFTTGTLVAWWTFDGHAQDQSPQAYHGTLHGNPQWVPGVSNQAVALNTKEDYIIIPPMNLNTDTMTITLWVKTEEVITNPGLVFTRDGSANAGLWFNMNNNLRYNWNDDRETWLWDSGLFAPNQTWTFAALVVDPEQATMYMHDGTTMKSATHNHRHGAAKFDGITNIGHDPRWGTVRGAIDEVRIYCDALGREEIMNIYTEGK